MAAKSVGSDRADTAARRSGTYLGGLRRWLGCLAVLRRAEGGASAVEFALLAPALLAFIVPVIDLGMAFSSQIKVQQAAQAGAQYALLWGGSNASNIESVVTGATTLSVSASPAPSQSCGCISGTTVTLSGTPPCSPANGVATCANGLTPGTYVTVNAKASYTPLLPYASVLSNPTTLTAQSIVRIQ